MKTSGLKRLTACWPHGHTQPFGGALGARGAIGVGGMVNAFDFESVVERRGTGSLKWDRYAGTDILPLWVADMDFAAPQVILDALHARVGHGIFGYTRPTDSVVQVVLDYLRRRTGVAIEPAWIVWLPGLVPALSMACASVGDAGDRILTCTPVYPPFLHVHHDSQRQLDVVPLVPQADGSYDLDWERLEAAVTPRTRVFLFCNPHNPAGRVFSRQQIQQLGAFCEKHGIVICADEIHCDLILDESLTPHVSALTLDEDLRRRSITLLAASKTYNIAGLACALAVVPDARLRRSFVQAAGKRLAEISPLAFAATEAAYALGEPWRQRLLEVLRGHRQRLTEAVAALEGRVRLTPLEATYLAWLDVRPLQLDEPQRWFEQRGLGFSPGADFGAPGFVRMNFGCPRATLDQALDRLQRAVERG